MRFWNDSTNAEAYSDWVTSNEDFILDCYIEQIDEFPDSIYEGYLDDDYPDAEDRYIDSLTIDLVPDEFVQDMYDSYCETRGDEE